MRFQTCKPLFFFYIVVTILATSLVQIQAQFPSFDPYAFLHVIPNPDGSITRIKEFFPTVPPNTSINAAYSKDVPLNPDKKTWVRVYLPHKPEPLRNLPIVVFAHGGQFILLSTATPSFDTFLSFTARQLNVLVVSVEYRLAPEHRLPAAYDDVLDALFWVKEKRDEWVQNYGDVTKCVMMGESAGGNIVYNVGLAASSLTRELKPLVVRGLVLVQPFFGGGEQSQQSIFKTNGVFPPDASNFPAVVGNLVWNMTLPIGAKRNNPYFNPMFGGGSRNLNTIKNLGWRVAIAGRDGDGLFPMQIEVFNFLKRRGLDVIGDFGKGYYHGVFIGDASQAQILFEFVRSVFSTCFA